MSNVSKLEVMRNDENLFKEFIKAVERGQYLNAVVFLNDNSVEVVVFVMDESVVCTKRKAAS